MSNDQRKDARVSLRVPASLKNELAEVLAEIRAEGHVVAEADVVHMFIREGLSQPEIVQRLQQHRRNLHQEQG